jgi:hypothetical protein
MGSTSGLPGLDRLSAWGVDALEGLTAMEDLMRSMPSTDPGSDPDVDTAPTLRRNWADVLGAWPLRRRVAVAVLAPVMFIVSLAATGGWAVVTAPGWTALVVVVALASATTLATYLPLPGAGLKLEFGCTPCAAVAAVSVLASLGLLSSAPHEVPTAVLALGVVAFGLRQRLANLGTCPA